VKWVVTGTSSVPCPPYVKPRRSCVHALGIRCLISPPRYGAKRITLSYPVQFCLFFCFFWLGLPNPVPSEPSTPSLSRVYHFPDFYSCSRPWFIPRALLSLSVSLVAFRICMLLRLSSLPLPLIVNNFWSIIRLGQIVTRLSLPTFSGISKSNSP